MPNSPQNTVVYTTRYLPYKGEEALKLANEIIKKRLPRWLASITHVRARPDSTVSLGTSPTNLLDEPLSLVGTDAEDLRRLIPKKLGGLL